MAEVAARPWAVFSDWTGVTNLGGNNGGFETEAEAVEYLISRLEGERVGITEKLAAAKRNRRRLRIGKGGSHDL